MPVARDDLRRDRLDGEAELVARRDLMLEWYERLEAPAKRRYSFPDAAHAVAFEEFEALGPILTEEVLPATYPTR